LYDFQPEQPGVLADVIDFLGTDEPDAQTETLWRDVLRELEHDRLIMLAETMGFAGTAAMITGAGRADVEARRKRRNDPARRNAAARDAVLRWVYAHPKAPDLKPMLTDPDGLYEGQPFDVADLEAALSYLHSKGLVTGVEVAEFVLLHVELTDKGIDCAEHFGGSVSDYILRGQDTASTVTHNVNFHSAVSGPVAWGNRDVSQTVTTTGIAGDELTTLVRAIAQAAPALALSSKESDSLRVNAEIVEAELVNDEPDLGVIRTFLHRLLGTLGKAGDSALALVLGAYARELMKKIGIPVE